MAILPPLTWELSGSNPGFSDYTMYAAHNGGLFVAVGYSGIIYTSPDGTTWTNRASGTTEYLYSVAYGAGRWVVVGEGDTVVTSTDGVTWTAAAFGDGADMYSVIYAGGQFIASGWAAIYSSTDGVAWTKTPSTNHPTAAIEYLTYSGAVYAATAGWSVITSTDGTTWTEHETGFSTSGGPKGLAYTSSGWCVVYRDTTYGSEQAVVYTSADAETWALVANPPTASSAYAVRGIGDTVLVSVPNSMWRSDDGGTTWTEQTLPGTPEGADSFVHDVVNNEILALDGTNTIYAASTATGEATLTLDMPSVDIALAASPIAAFLSLECLSMPSASIALAVPALSFAWQVPQTTITSPVYRLYLDDLELPMSSFQGNLRAATPTYLSAVVPNATKYADEISARANGQLVIKNGVRFGDGTEQLEEIARVDLETIASAEGGRSNSVKLSGHATRDNAAPKTRTLQNVTYRASGTGKRRYRATLDRFLKAGDYAYCEQYDETIKVGLINYTVSPASETMEITEA